MPSARGRGARPPRLSRGPVGGQASVVTQNRTGLLYNNMETEDPGSGLGFNLEGTHLGGSAPRQPAA
jgi:hypothetical protein